LVKGFRVTSISFHPSEKPVTETKNRLDEKETQGGVKQPRAASAAPAIGLSWKPRSLPLAASNQNPGPLVLSLTRNNAVLAVM
jgi:hypothetical protein